MDELLPREGMSLGECLMLDLNRISLEMLKVEKEVGLVRVKRVYTVQRAASLFRIVKFLVGA